MLEQTKLHFVDSVDSAADMMTWLSTLSADEVLGFDTETSGLSPYVDGARVRLVQIGAGDAGWAIPYEQWSGVVADLFKRWTGDLVGHNSKFDANFLKVCCDIDVFDRRGTVHDTMLFSHLVHPHQSHALKSLGDRYVQRGASAGQRLLDEAMTTQGWTWDTIPTDFHMYWAYGALDAVITQKLFKTFDERFPMIRPSQSYELETAVLPCFAAMERRGMLCDMDYIAVKRDEILTYCAWADEHLATEYGVGNRQSNAQVAKALLEHGAQLTEKTGSGLWQLDKDVLLSIQEPATAAALADLVLKTRKMTKINSTYFNNLHERVHPNIRQCGASTGRSSVTGPALQTLPRGTMVRDAFIPDPGHLMVACDLDQVEMRILAHLCGDANLIHAINSGDLHTNTARLVYNDPDLQNSDPRRQTAKNAAFAKVYGAGVEQFSATAGIPVEEGAKFLAMYDETFPGVPEYAKRIAREVTENGGSIDSPFGRRHRLGDDRSYAMLNYLIQGTAAEVMKLNIIALDSAGFGENMMVPVHDEIIMSIPAGDAVEASKEIERCMTYNGFDVPLTASADIADRWGTKYVKDPVAKVRRMEDWYEKHNAAALPDDLITADYFDAIVGAL